MTRDRMLSPGMQAPALVSDQVGPRALGDLFSKIGSDRFYSAATIDASPALLVTELITGMSSVTPMLLAPKWDMEDPQGKLAVLFGANPAVSHGHLSSMSDPVRRMKAFMARGGQIFVVDPRRTKSDDGCLASPRDRTRNRPRVAPGLLREVLRTGRLSEDFIEGTTPDERRRLEASLVVDDLHHTARLTGLPESQIELVSSALLRAGTATVETGTGINFQRDGVVTEWLRWVLLIATGSLDKTSGGMPISPGWFDALDLRESQFEEGTFPRGRSKTRPDLPGVGGEYAVSGMPDEIESGELQGLVVAGGNPVSLFPNPAHTIEALQSLRFLAVADVVETETTALATNAIPVAGQLESMSIMPFTRRVVVSPAMLAPDAQRKPLWWVAVQARTTPRGGRSRYLEPRRCDGGRCPVIDCPTRTTRLGRPDRPQAVTGSSLPVRAAISSGASSRTGAGGSCRMRCSPSGSAIQVPGLEPDQDGRGLRPPTESQLFLAVCPADQGHRRPAGIDEPGRRAATEHERGRDRAHPVRPRGVVRSRQIGLTPCSPGHFTSRTGT